MVERAPAKSHSVWVHCKALGSVGIMHKNAKGYDWKIIKYTTPIIQCLESC